MLKNDKKLSKITIDNYLEKLNVLKRENINYNLPDVKQIENFFNIKNYAPQSKMAYICAILWYCKKFKIKNESVNNLRTKMIGIKMMVQNDYKKNKLSAVQKKNYADWDTEILPTYEKIKKSNKTEDILLLSMWILIPPRRIEDFVKMRYIEKENIDVPPERIIWFDDEKYNRYKYNIKDVKNHSDFCEEKDTRENFYIKTSCGSFFWFKKFKTDSSLGFTYISIREDLDKIIQQYIIEKKIKPNDILININRNALTARLIYIFQRELGKKVGASMLRHSFLTYLDKKNDMTYDDRERISIAMGHGIIQQLMYVKKEHKKNKDTDNKLLKFMEETINFYTKEIDMFEYNYIKQDYEYQKIINEYTGIKRENDVRKLEEKVDFLIKMLNKNNVCSFFSH